MSKKEVSPLSQYIDPSGDLSTSDFKRGYWYVTHKLLLRKIVIGLLLVWSSVTIGIGLFVWGQYLFVGYWADEDLLISESMTFQNYAALQPLYEAQPLSFEQSRLFQAADGKYDFVTMVYNPNEKWVGTVTFHYVYADVITPSEQQTVLPGATQALIIYGHETPTYPSDARLIIDDIAWQRVDPHIVKDPGAYMDERLRFRVDEFTFTRPGGEVSVLTNALDFTLTNTSVYSYWDASFHLLLQRGDILVGVIPLSELQFRAGDVRDVNIFTFADLNQVDSIEVLPRMNVFDPSVFMPAGL